MSAVTSPTGSKSVIQAPSPEDVARRTVQVDEFPHPAGDGVAKPSGWLDVAAVVCFLLGGLYVTARLWVGLDSRIPAADYGDPMFFEWVLEHAARFVTHGGNPLFTERLNAPDGVNLIANTSILGLGIPMTPVTLAFGPHVSFLILIVLGLAGTAAGWYWVFSRHLVDSRFAAFVGAAFCGFAPAMVAHSNAHVNFTFQVLVPFIVWRVIALVRSQRIIRDGIILGLLVTYQIFIGEEVLFFTALACAVFLTAYAVNNWSWARLRIMTLIKGLGVAAAVATPLLAYPLWYQFFGPQNYHGIPNEVSHSGVDYLSYPAFATETLLGNGPGAANLADNPVEENTFYGLPLIIFLSFLIFWLWRDLLARAVAITGMVFAVISLGPELVMNGEPSGLPLPWRLFSSLPLFNAVLPPRFALVVIPVVGALFALGWQRAVHDSQQWLRVLWYVGLVAALLPIAPTPLSVRAKTPTPEFIASGTWREYVTPGHTMVTVPLPDNRTPAMRWATEEHLEMILPRGYFLGPGGVNDRAIFGAPPRFTSTLFKNVAAKGKARVKFSANDRLRVSQDLEYWRASVVVLATQRQEKALLPTVTALLGPATKVQGVWVWPISPSGRGVYSG